MGRLARGSSFLVACGCAAVTTLAAPSARAFEVKHTSSGEVVKWSVAQESFVVDPSVAAAVPGGDGAVQAAVAAWSGQQGAPTLTTSAGTGGGKVAVDGQNTIVYAPHGFAPAGNALAVTVLSYDEISGDIVDADIVINGRHRFAVLPADACPAAGTPPMSNEGGSEGGSEGAESHSGDGSPAGASAAFDLQHVLTHEAGHALGLADVYDGSSSPAMMYGVSWPGDASKRALTSDDQDGLDAIYGPSAAARSGCGSASVAGGRVRTTDAWVSLALVAGALVWAAGRRRARVRVLVAGGALLAAAVADPTPALSRPQQGMAMADARAVVVAASTNEVDGVLQTTLDLVPVACRTAPCPARARAVVWGGTANGITQVVGDSRAPAIGDAVDLAFSTEDHAADVRAAVVVAANVESIHGR